MRPFAKLSARQWEVLVVLVRQAGRGTGFGRVSPRVSRGDVFFEEVTEAGRVATARSFASLVRRGLVTRQEEPTYGRPRFRGQKHPWYTLAVSPRAVLNAAVDAGVKSVDVEWLRWCVENAERIALRAARPEARRVSRRARAEAARPGVGAARVRCDVLSALNLAAREGAPDPAARVVGLLAGIIDRPSIEDAVADLKASGRWDQVIVEEARGPAEDAG
jgi:hypothetical protein